MPQKSMEEIQMVTILLGLPLPSSPGTHSFVFFARESSPP